MATIIETGTNTGDRPARVTLDAGDRFTGTIDTFDEIDFIDIDVRAGETYRVTATAGGGTPALPFIALYNDGGRDIFDSASLNVTGTQEGIVFAAPEDGVLTIGVEAWDSTGGYVLDFETAPDLSVGTLDDFADMLTRDYWLWRGESPGAAWDTDSVTYDLGDLPDAAAELARMAFQAWTDITGIAFREVANNGDIAFINDEEGAWASFATIGQWVPGEGWQPEIIEATINIADNIYLADPTLGSMGYYVFIHEIGHALGLGHSGRYNGFASYDFDADFVNDTLALSVMSYWETYHPAFETSDLTVPLTAMPADIAAMERLYGPVDANTGDTSYGLFGDRAATNLPEGILGEYTAIARGQMPGTISQREMIGYTIHDTGGWDVLDARHAPDSVEIDLAPMGISTIGGVQGIVISQSSIIEEARGGAFTDHITGNAAANVLWGGGAEDTLRGEGGDDTLRGGTGDDRLLGLDGRDVLLGGEGADAMDGNAGDDLLSGYTGDDMLRGGWGADTLDGGAGDDTLMGGSETDTARFLSSTSREVTMTLRADGGLEIAEAQGTDLLWDVERLSFSDRGMQAPKTGIEVSGTGGADTLTGGAFDDTIEGGRGDDAITGGTGHDDIRGGAGLDDIDGGAGDDVLRGGRDRDTLNGGDGWDSLAGQREGDVLYGGAGEDTLKGGGGDDDLYGDGDADFLRGGTRRDLIEGGKGDDTLIGNGFQDTLSGGGGDDILNGGGAADQLAGGRGDDWLKGGSGADVFQFAGNPDIDEIFAMGDDTIVDFGRGNDILLVDASATGRATVAQMRATSEIEGDGLRLSFDEGGVLLLGVTTFGEVEDALVFY